MNKLKNNVIDTKKKRLLYFGVSAEPENGNCVFSYFVVGNRSAVVLVEIVLVVNVVNVVVGTGSINGYTK